ncbi:RAMP superfamily CRISPR-associated protein [Peptostreptococcaceae bacterium AGR-M142]
MSYQNKVKRYIIKMKNVSPLIVGTGEDGIEGLLTRDKKALIQGSSIAGLFRSFLIEILKNEKDSKVIREIQEVYKAVYHEYITDNLNYINKRPVFQTIEQSEFISIGDKNIIDKELVNINKKNSTVYFYDFYSTKELEGKDYLNRTHTKMDEKTGTTEAGSLFEQYKLAKGLKFISFIDLRKFDNDNNEQNKNNNDNDEAIYKLTDKYLSLFIYKLTNESISVGAKTNFGCGKFNGESYFYEFNFDYDDNNEKLKKEEKREVLSKYLSDQENLLSGEIEINFNKLKDSEDSEDYKPLSVDLDTDDNMMIFELEFYCEDGMMIKSSNPKKINGKTVTPSYKENDNYIIPSSSIKGILRNQINSVNESLKRLKQDNNYDIANIYDDIITYIFGGSVDEISENINIKGKAKFEDIEFDNYRMAEDISSVKSNIPIIFTKPRIKIDRFTGGAMNGTLFNEQLVIIPKDYDNKPKIRIKIDNNANEIAKGYILMALRDLANNKITIGSGANVGYGFINPVSLKITKHKNDYIYYFEEQSSNNKDAEDEFSKIIQSIVNN